MSNVWRTFRDYAANTVQTALNLRLPISAEPGEEVAHKIAVVPTLLKDLDFLHKFELVRCLFYFHSHTLILLLRMMMAFNNVGF